VHLSIKLHLVTCIACCCLTGLPDQQNGASFRFVSCELCNLLTCGFVCLQLPSSMTKSLGIFKW